MQSAKVKMMGQLNLLSIGSEGVKKVRIHPNDKYCVQVNMGEIIPLTASNNKIEGEPGVIDANKTVLVYPDVNIVPRHFHALISYNPDLLKLGAIITTPGLVRPGTENGVFLQIRTTKKLDLNDIDNLFEIYMLD